MSLEIVPIPFKDACNFIAEHHRHHKPPQGHKFSIAVSDGVKIVGVCTVGRPVARNISDTWTLEITRVCTDGTKNASSMLYAAAWRAARALGYKQLITYCYSTESGVSLKAAGYKVIGIVKGRQWTCKSRPRVENPIKDKKKYGRMAV